MIKAWSYIEEYKGLRKKILKSIDRTLKSGQIFFGKELQKFEKRFIKENNLKYGVAVGSGTDALYISLLGLGIKPGDEIITEKREVFIFQKSDLMEQGIYNISLNDLVEFPFYPEPPDEWNYKPQLYRVTGVQDLLSLIKIFAKKASV